MFTLRVVRYCNRLHRDVLDAVSLEMFKSSSWDGALIQWEVSLPIAGRGWD